MARRERPRIMALYRWDFEAALNGRGRWSGWGQATECRRFEAPARRGIPSPDYPLSGPYSSTAKGTLDHHGRLCVRAGLDGLALLADEKTKPAALKKVAKALGTRRVKVALAFRAPARIAEETGISCLAYLAAALDPLENVVRAARGLLVFALEANRWTAQEWAECREEIARRRLKVSLVTDALDRGEVGEWDVQKHAVGAAGLLHCGAASERAVGGKPAWVLIQPGEDLRRVCPGAYVLPRKRGETYLAQWRQALDGQAAGVLVDSFNDWTRGTEIEPSREHGDRYLILTRLCAEALRKGRGSSALTNESMEAALTAPRPAPALPPRRGLKADRANPWHLSVPRPLLVMSHHWFSTPAGPAGRYTGWTGRRTVCNPSTGEFEQDKIDPASQWRAPGERKIVSAHYPESGLYDTQDPKKLSDMVRQAKAAGIDGFIVDWFGQPSTRGVQGSTGLLLEAARKEGDFWVSILYDWDRREDDIQVAIDELDLLFRSHGNHPNLFRAGGRPAVWTYFSSHWPPEEWRKIYQAMRERGEEMFWITDGWQFGHFSWPNQDDYVKDADGIGSYNPLGDETVAAMGKIARRFGKLFSCGAQPGHDHTNLNQRMGPWLRNKARLYAHQWLRTLKHSPDIATVTSWNEWHEGTEIEPSLEFGDFYLRLTAYFSRLYKAGAGPGAFDNRDLERLANVSRT